MKCLNCGNEIQDGALFCDNCGQKVEADTQISQKRHCGNCGAEIEENADFCGNCGFSIKSAAQTGEKSRVFCGNCGAELEDGIQFCSECGTAVGDIQSEEIMPGKSVKKRKRTGIVVAVIVIACILIAAVILGYMMYPRKTDIYANTGIPTNTSTIYNSENKDKTSPSVSPSATATPEATAAATEEIPVSNEDQTATLHRTDLYDSSLTYKRMPDIHNTVLTDDKTFNSLKAVIEEFDSQCADYMNEITDAVPSYLKKGTTAYNQQVEYKQKHPTLNQSYKNIDVINARQGSGYYYVWVAEEMNINENGVAKVTTDHWVYKLENDNGNWYICDYTVDPAF